MYFKRDLEILTNVFLKLLGETTASGVARLWNFIG